MTASGPADAAEQFKQSLAATTRAIAQKPELEFETPPDTSPSDSPTQHSRLTKRALAQADIARTRGQADALGLRHRHHRPGLHARLRPGGVAAAAVFDSLEQARIEALGAQRMPGVGSNLDASLSAELRAARPETSDVAASTALAARLALRKFAIERDLPSDIEAVRAHCPDVSAVDFEGLAGCMESQREFAELARQAIAALGLAEQLAEDGEPEPDEDPDTASEAAEGPTDEMVKEELASEEQEETATEATTSTGQSEDGEDLEAEGDDEGSPPSQPPRPDPTSWADPSYKVYSREHDEVVLAGDLCSLEDLAKYRAQLDAQIEPLRSAVGRLANRLQRRLQAQQARKWSFDLDEGLLDTARLVRVVIDPLAPLSFKIESDTSFKDTVVTLLLDNSGSMRGRPIATAAICTDILGRTLERCGVKVEILGFTTRNWKGGKSREAWIAAGRPSGPGRLNDLRHIVYKDADVRWQKARLSLGLMLREGLLKENIDGEALEWAHGRLLARPERRKILMVISDGAPIDDSTLAVNGSSYLEHHLRRVIAAIDRMASVEILAIGIGHDVTRYYRRAVTITSADQLAGAMTEQLADLFEEDDPRSGRRRRIRESAVSSAAAAA